MKCPTCMKQEMVHDTRDIPYNYKGQTTIISAVTGDFCPSCDEAVFDHDESQRISEAMMAFNKKVNATVVDPKFIVSVRKKLNLDQKEAAEIFGGGPNAFSRYETGKALPSPSLITLLRLLDNHPELLEEIRQSALSTNRNFEKMQRVEA